MSIKPPPLNIPTIYILFSSRTKCKISDIKLTEIKSEISKYISINKIIINHFIGAPLPENRITPYIYNIYYTGDKNINLKEYEKKFQSIIFNLLQDYLM